ncbi:MAG: DNA mismatch repair protein MutS [Bacteroidetes bacterium]|nr:DNA mismatch repair protein MutS [Bacteroidota bacterium]
MKQYFAIKAKHPDAILLFRVGDFYETFGEDAIKTSKILGIVLTKRANGSSHVELAGFPHHSVDIYLPKLIKSGHRVAICEQLEDPKKTKHIVKRGVTELVTPGTSISDKILENKENNYLAALSFSEENIGLAFIDLSTGEFLVTEGEFDFIDNLISTFNPSEIIYSKNKQELYNHLFDSKRFTFLLEEWLFSFEFAEEKLLNHFDTKSLKGFGIDALKSGICAAGVILHYLSENKHDHLKHINQIRRLEKDQFVWLDKFSVKNLELISSIQFGGKSLFEVLDSTLTPMGGRLLRKWLVMPLKEIRSIKERQEIVKLLLKKEDISDVLTDLLSQIGDMERLISKVALKKINPREILHIEKSLHIVEQMKDLFSKGKNSQLRKISDKLNPCSEIRKKIANTLEEEPPVLVNKGDLIRKGVSEKLDELKELKKSGKDYLVKIREREVINTGITSLKVGFNNVFGYYLEVTNAHKNKVPEEWLRKQTLVNAERYITEELKVYEEKILNAEEKILEIEQEIYQDLVFELADYIHPIQQNSSLIAFIDCLLSFASMAKLNNYNKPDIDQSFVIDIRDGRHPVIERSLAPGEEYIPNDIYLNNNNQQLIILTGPNMSGKSAVLRQTALIVLMAQMGSYVPATSARMGIVDKIFTRVGASDNLALGESTFMIEMIETASILNNISDRSLIVLDEIGRGTSTYDGISIAWAITEYLHHNKFKPKTLFATHYHELNEIAKTLKRVKNFNVSVKEYKNKIIFLRKLKPGGSEHSFGINVAQLAGVPKDVVSRAQEILAELEKQRAGIKNDEGIPSNSTVNIQLKMFDVGDPDYERLKMELDKIDINSLTPIEALMKVNYLKGLIKKISE